MIISRSGKAMAVIILPASPSPVEQFAAEELKKYVKKISEAELQITSEPAEGYGKIFIGGPRRNKWTAQIISEKKFTETVPGPEGMMIYAENDNLILAGSDSTPLERDRGTLYAVYEFLEKYLGCSFVAYGNEGSQIGEYIPKCSLIEVKHIDYVKEKCDIPYRGAVVQFDAFEVNSMPWHGLTPSLIDWLGKNRINRVMLMLTSYEIIKNSSLFAEFVKRGICMTVGHHDSGMFFLPPHGNDFFPEEYYLTHPEYYRLEKDGSRYEPSTKWHGQLIFDMRNQECIKQIGDNIIAWIQENEYVDIINFWPNDDVDDVCCCDRCSSYDKTENYVWMTNQIADYVGRKMPHVKIDLLVYQDLWSAPSMEKLSDNLLIDVATWGPDMIRKLGCNDGSGLIGSPTEKNALQWAKLGNNLVYYDYYMTNFGSNQVYCPMADEIVKINEHFAETGYCKGTATQMEPYNLWNYLFNFYVHGRKGYDIALSFEELLNSFSMIFREASPFVKEYINYVEQFSDGQGENGNVCAAYFASHVDTEKVYAIFERAYDSLPEGTYKDNLRLLRMAFRYSDLEVNVPQSEEILYISKNFGSFWGELGQTGYGISTYAKPAESGFKPDKWYQFSSSI